MCLRSMVLLLLGLLAGDVASACRCAPQTLAHYFASADVVGFATVHGTSAQEHSLALHITPVGMPYKGSFTGLQWTTGADSASCGLAPQPDRQYLLFATVDEDSDPPRAHVGTCDGSRMFDPRHGEQGVTPFEEVPARFVVTQLALLQGGDAIARYTAALTRPRLIGLLDLKALAHGGHVDVRAAPRAEATIVRRITDIEEIAHREASYEFRAALVVDRRDGWYALRLDEQAPQALAWVAAQEVGTYWPLEELLQRRLNYFTPAWDGLLWAAPGAGRVLRFEHAPERAASVIDVADIAGSLWLEVRLLASSPCDGGEVPLTATGWIPAWSGDGEPNVWFYSRGC